MLETDYLVIGAGAMGMAFADVLLTETDARVVLVDRHAKPGGHWNDAYPFVRLHQPSAFYGVNSRPLGADRIDTHGWNAGLYELASGAEVLAYYDQVMHQQFLPSGRVEYFPMSSYEPGADNRDVDEFRSLVTGKVHQVRARTLVDATYMNVSVPSQRPPAYDVADGAFCAPLNALPSTQSPHDGFVVIGAGKTGADACLWLLANGVDPDTIRWIMPRDSWYLDRAVIQPGDGFDESTAAFGRSFQHAAESTSIDDLFDRLEADGALLRLDPEVEPTMYRCSTVTQAELEQLRRIDNVVRLGRVRSIGVDEIVLDEGAIPTTPNTFHVDCSADGLERRPPVAVFDAESSRITLQTVRHCQQVFSAAFIAHVEAAYDDIEKKNALCTVVPHPDTALDWLRTMHGNIMNMATWSAEPELIEWLANARLDGFSQPGEPSAATVAARETAMGFALPALEKLQAYLQRGVATIQ
jgi:NAD(P)-binding Rossmann-like domain